MTQPPARPTSSYDVESAWRGGTWVWDDVYNNTPWGHYYTETALRYLRQAVVGHSIRSVLDVGAGTGRFAIPLHRWGYEVTALDLDAKALEELHLKEPGIQTLHGDFSELHLGTYDMIMSVGTVKYFESFAFFLEKSHRSLNRAGLIFSEMLSPENARMALKRLVGRGLGPAGRAAFPTQMPPQACRTALAHAGFGEVVISGSCLLAPSHTSKSTTLFKLAALVERSLGLNRLPSLSAQYYFTATRKPSTFEYKAS